MAAPKRGVRMPEVVLGVLLVAGCALGAVLWQRQANTTATFVVAAGPIERGAVIGAADLAGGQFGGDTATLIPGSAAQSLIGQTAAVDIAAGTPLSASLLSVASGLGLDEALTSIALEPGEMPPDLARDDTVRVVVTVPAVGGTGTTTVLEPVAVVWSVDPSGDGVSTVVTLRGPLQLSADVAAAASVRLARVGS